MFFDLPSATKWGKWVAIQIVEACQQKRHRNGAKCKQNTEFIGGLGTPYSTHQIPEQ